MGDRACGLAVGGRFAPPLRGCVCVDLAVRWAPPLFPGGSGCLDSLGGLGLRGCIWCAIRVFILGFSYPSADAGLVRFRGLSWRWRGWGLTSFLNNHAVSHDVMGVLPGDFVHSYQMNRFDCRYRGLIVCFDYPLHFPQVLNALMRALLRK